MTRRGPSSGSRLHTERSEEHTSELQSQSNLVCRLLLEKKKNNNAKAKTIPRQYTLATAAPSTPKASTHPIHQNVRSSMSQYPLREHCALPMAPYRQIH